MKHAIEQKRTSRLVEFIIAIFALATLLASQWMLSTAIHGSNYYGSDGKMAQAIILAAIKFAGIFGVTNLSPIMGVGSQMLPKNVWANPSLWPFAFVDRELATDISTLIALAVFVVACYVMAALGLLARIEPGSWRGFGLMTGGILALLFYSIYDDPLFTFVASIGWVVPFAVVTFGSLRIQTSLVRGAALAISFGLLLLSGVLVYVYTLLQFTARAQYPDIGDRTRAEAGCSANEILSVLGHRTLAEA